MYRKFYQSNVIGNFIPPQIYIGVYILIVWYIHTTKAKKPKPKVQRHKRSNDGYKRRVRQTHNQNEQVIDELK